MPDAAGSITQFFEQLRAGNRDAAAPLCQRFLPRLIALAKKTLAGRPQRVDVCRILTGWQPIPRLERRWHLDGLLAMRQTTMRIGEQPW
jgi:hypothetical protein